MNIGHVQQKQFTAKDKSITKYMELSLRSPGIAFSATLTKVKEKTQSLNCVIKVQKYRLCHLLLNECIFSMSLNLYDLYTLQS